MHHHDFMGHHHHHQEVIFGSEHQVLGEQPQPQHHRQDATVAPPLSADDTPFRCDPYSPYEDYPHPHPPFSEPPYID
jgi:hypothetical protein